MRNQLRRFLSSPVFKDAETSRILYLLNIILPAAIALGLLNTFSILFFAPEIADGLWVNAALVMVEAGLLYLARRGYVRQVAVGLCFIIWLALTFILYATGGLANPLFNAYAIVITIAAILLGTAGIAVFGSLCIATTIIFWAAADALPPYQQAYTPAHIFTNFSTIFLTMTVLLTVAARHIRQSVEQLRQKEKSLEERNLDLEKTIQEREQAYAAMYAAEEKYRALFENAIEGIFQATPEGNLVLVNPAFARMLGYPSPTVLLAEVTEMGKLLSADVLQQQTLFGTAREQGEVYDFECEAFRRDGSVISISICLRVVKDADGNAIFYEGTAENISIRRQVEQALRASETRFRTLFERAPLGIAIVDRAAHPIVVNRAFEQMVGYSEAEISEMRFSDFTHPNDVESNMELFNQFWEGDIDHYQLEKRYIRKDRSDLWVRVNVSEIPDASHQGKLVYAFVEDITRQKQAQALAIELAVTAERERVNILRQFLSDASHDLRTPLATINTSLYLLRKACESEKQIEYVERLELQARRIHKLIEDLFFLTRLDIAEAEFEFVACDLNQLVQQLATQHSPSLALRQHQLALELDETITRVSADPYMLNIALGHLMVNALHFSPPNSSITIRTYLQMHRVMVEIQDTGMGISPDDLPHIFERFYRADKARQAESGGSGLGLTIAHKIVTAHQGAIEVESQVGEGSRFRVCLPLTR